MAYRPETPSPATGFQAEGLLGLVNADGSAEVFFGERPESVVPTIRVRTEGGRLVVSADGDVSDLHAQSLQAGLVEVGDRLAARLAIRPLTPLPAGWCSWYTYWNEVTAQDVLANLAVIDQQDLGMEVVQVDDGYQREIGDWLEVRPAFGDLDEVAARILDSGRVPGTVDRAIPRRSELEPGERRIRIGWSAERSRPPTTGGRRSGFST